jgi:hypothetical protein
MKGDCGKFKLIKVKECCQMAYNENLKVTRTLGFEIECFVDDYDLYVPHSDVCGDGSLHGGYGCEVEVKSDPITDLNIVETIYECLHHHEMNVNDTCGLHIHVDTSDYTVFDKAKLLRFGAGIELLMLALVENYREGNNYCEKLHKGWRKLFRPSFIDQDIPFDSFRTLYDLGEYVRRNSSHRHSRIWNGRYQWLNACVEHSPTCEFRIFSATTDYQQAQKFGMLAYQIIETVKHSTIEQLQFIIKSLYQSATIDEMFTKFFDSIGLSSEFRPEILNYNIERYIDNKYCKPIREGAVSGEEQQAV